MDERLREAVQASAQRCGLDLCLALCWVNSACCAEKQERAGILLAWSRKVDKGWDPTEAVQSIKELMK